MKYYKYILDNDTLLPTVTEEEVQNPIDGNYVILGNECTKKATFNEEGEVITQAEFSDRILVDVVWNSEEPSEWTPFRVVPKTHNHWYGGESMRLLWESCNL